MGWATSVEGEMIFYKETWRNREDVEERIADNQKEIESIKIEMAMLAAGRIEDLIQTKDCESNEIDIPMALRWKLEDFWERMEDAQYENWKLGFLLENWDKRQGDFIDNYPQYPQYPQHPDNTPYIARKQPDDLNSKIEIGDINDRQLKLEFDASIEETPEIETSTNSHSLGNLSDPQPHFYA